MERSFLYDYFNDCWLEGSITSKGMYGAVAANMITDEERSEIMKQPRGNMIPEIPWGETA